MKATRWRRCSLIYGIRRRDRTTGTPAAMPSVCAAVPEHEPDGLHNDLQIKAQGPVAKITEIVFDSLSHFFNGLGLAAQTVDLRPPGDSRLHLVAHHVTVDQLSIHLVVRNSVGTRTHDAHAPLQHVDEL